MNSERKQRRIDRYNELADKADGRSKDAYERSNSYTEHIPLGQPILVGHHSEKAHRRTLDKSWNAMGESVRESEKAEYYRHKAMAAENNDAIYTEDEDAVKRLEEKITCLEQQQETMKERNKIVKNKKLSSEEKVAKLIEMGLGDKSARSLLVPDFCGRIGYPDCTLTNNSAKIRAAKKRLETVKCLKSQSDKEYEVNGFRVTENPQENRFQIFIGYNPGAEICQKFHAAGYRFTRELGCWQCYMKHWNIEAGKKILESLENKKQSTK